MSVSSKSSTSKKSTSTSHSNHHPATPETTTSPAPAHASDTPTTDAIAGPVTPTVTVARAPSTSAGSGSASSQPTIRALASTAIAQIDALEAMLNLNIVIPPNDKSQIATLNRVSDAAIGLASDIVSAAPERFPDFTSLPASASYVEWMGQVGARASELAGHIQKSVQNQRAPAATQALALYAVAKGLGRMTVNETMREKVTALKAEIAPKLKNPKPKKTEAEKAAKRLADSTAKRVAKAKATLAKAGISVPETDTPVAPAPAPVAPAPTPSNAASSAPNGAALATPPASH